MIRRALWVILFGVLLVGSSTTAGLAETETSHKQTFTFVDVLPCTTIPYSITATSNGVVHFNEKTLPDGTVVAQFTFTETAKFTARPVSGSGAVFHGSYTVWGGGMAFNPVYDDDGNIVSADKWVNTFTFTVRGTGEDGTRLFLHQTQHINVNPNNTNEFFNDSCDA